MNKFFIKDSNGKKSLTATAFLIGFIIVNLKLLFSGISIGDITISVFTGVEYAASITGLGSIYVLRRNFGNPGEKD